MNFAKAQYWKLISNGVKGIPHSLLQFSMTSKGVRKKATGSGLQENKLKMLCPGGRGENGWTDYTEEKHKYFFF